MRVDEKLSNSINPARWLLITRGKGLVASGADDLLKYRYMACYDRCLKEGLPIATGVIEGACRHLVNDRLNITGARWRLASAEAILKLWALRPKGNFDAYWEFHKAKELERNHNTIYQRFPIIGIA